MDPWSDPYFLVTIAAPLSAAGLSVLGPDHADSGHVECCGPALDLTRNFGIVPAGLSLRHAL